MTMSAPLPKPSLERWQPLRCGLVNLFKFDDQQFRFENGRLLLRGNNGTGKSRVLALTLPFLFDGQTAPHRVEPDTDSNKRMSWNLLMDKHEDRVGYSWLEMGRSGNAAEDGPAHFKTIGCGMRAVKGQSGVKTWFFITDQRIGLDFSLCRGRVPLSKKRLIDAIGERGQVIETAETYRKAIDAAFFELGPQRYEAMLRLLIELRRPQLSRTLNEADLSRALSEALPPLDDRVITDVADAMSSLEKDRQELDDYKTAQAGVAVFLDTYRRYARIAARRSADPVRKTHSAYETAARDLRQADKDSTNAEQHFAQAEQSLSAFKKEHTQLETRVKTLAASPEMRSLEDLQTAEEQHKQTNERLEETRIQQKHAESDVARRSKEETDARHEFSKQRDTTNSFAAKAQTQAEQAALSDAHRRAADNLGLPDTPDSELTRRAVVALEQSIEQQRRAINHLKEHNQTVQRLDQKSNQAKQDRDKEQLRVRELIEQSREAGQLIETRVEQTIENYSAWLAGLKHLAPPETEPVSDRLADWVAAADEEPIGRSPLSDAIDVALRGFQQEHARSTAQAQSKSQAIATELDENRAAIGALEQGKHMPPEPPYTREASTREDRPGAPFWRVLDFSPEVDETAQRGIEAALESAGLLDAWLMPDGEMLNHRDDTFLLAPQMTAAPSRSADAASTLERALTPAEDLPEGMLPATIRRVLHAIGWDHESDREVWVASDGRWRNGPLSGRWHKPAVQHIGQTARDAERARRLERLREQAAALSVALQEANHRLTQLQQDEEEAGLERDTAPTDEPIRSAISDLFHLQRTTEKARIDAAIAEQAFIQIAQQLADAKRKRDEDARDLGLSDWTSRLDDLLQYLNDYRRAVDNLSHHCERLASLSEQADRARFELESTEKALTACNGRVAQADRDATSAKEKYEVLKQTIGTDAEQVRKEYRQAEEDLTGVNRSIDHAQKDKENAIENRTAARSKRDQAEREHATKQAARDRAIEALHSFASRGFLRLAESGIDDQVETASPWSATRGVEVARRIDAAFSEQSMSDEAWQRSKSDLLAGFEQLKETLGPKGYPPQNEPTADDLYQIVVPYQNQPRSVVELDELLGEEITHRQGLLDAREKQIIENHLIDEVAVHLHGLIQDAEQLVAQMNRQLKGKTMSTGMELRFKWSVAPDADDRLAAARRQLQQSPDAQNPEQRDALAAFLQHQIQQTKENNDLLPWRECLAEALDYRQWHLFGVERRPDQSTAWQALTKRTHGTGSGGEKAIALTIPQFAAASAHYHSASPLAPRLIMLDEAFVGVDPDMRSKCMGLLAEFDLDLVMTSESEWGCYPGLNGNAIYQLATRQGMDAVLCTRWVWNGQRKTQDTATDRPHDADEPSTNDSASLYEDAEKP